MYKATKVYPKFELTAEQKIAIVLNKIFNLTVYPLFNKYDNSNL